MRPVTEYCAVCTRVVLLCPECEKLLPLCGEQHFRGTTTILCRHCGCGIRIAVEVTLRTRNKEAMPASELVCVEGERR